MATVVCSLSCGHAGANTNDSMSYEQISDVQTQQTSNQDEYKSEILRALGVKGRAKTISHGRWSFEFSPDGQPVRKPVESEDGLSLVDEDEEVYASFSITIKDGKMTKIANNSRFFETEFNFTEYDGLLPVAGFTFVQGDKEKINISYPEKDSHGNWTKMEISSPGKGKDQGYPLVETREISYWPDGTTMADFVPSEIPSPSEDMIFALIRKIGKNGTEKEVFSNEFNSLLAKYLKKTGNEGVGGSTNNFFEWKFGMQPSELDMYTERSFAHHDDNGYEFIFSYEGKFPNGKTTERRIGVVELIYEDGQWKIDNLANDALMFDSFHCDPDGNSESWKTRMSH